MVEQPEKFWSESADELLAALQSEKEGLSSREAADRLVRFGPNRLKPKKRTDSIVLLANQFRSPIIMILIFSAILAFLTSDNVDSLIIVIIVVTSGALGFSQERAATNAVQRLLSMITTKVSVFRDGSQTDIPMENLVPGDITVLNAGDLVPGDCRLLVSKDLFVDEATMTGETFPAEKECGNIPPETALAKRTNSVFMGTHIVSGNGTALVVQTGPATVFGKLEERLRERVPVTEFERGIRRFGYLLSEVTMTFVLVIFALNVYFVRPVLDSFLFALALAVGIVPQLLPTIISINLAQGAKRMAKSKVVVKQLESIENFGSMSILCSDKTGTITEGKIHLQAAVDMNGQDSKDVLLYAYLNARYQNAYTNPIDEGIIASVNMDIGDYTKLDEIPYDFIRKRLSVLVAKGESRLIVTKGALTNILSVCTRVESAQGKVMDIGGYLDTIKQEYAKLSDQGYRTLGVCYRELKGVDRITKDDDKEMVFAGLLVLTDPPKEGIVETLAQLRELGVSLKVITGDNKLVATSVGRQIGMEDPHVVSGPEIRQMSDEALVRKSAEIDIFAEVEPNQKERIILALRKLGRTVGYMGDGINDAAAIHAADVGISVEGAVDVAKDAAQIVLLEKDLNVLADGIRAGRKTFANTMKYIFMTTSANFGNITSMAVASLILTFLPLWPKQILGLNLITDLPATTMGTDRVDPELVIKPRRWNLGFLTKFMVVFGLQSSLMDMVTFAVLLLVLNSSPDQFRNTWFLVSAVTELVTLLIVRTRKPFFLSRPSGSLIGATLVVLFVTLVLPYSPFAGLFDLLPLSVFYLEVVAVIVLLYTVALELTKHVFYAKVRE
jgi:Mg2+-importing ATPase